MHPDQKFITYLQQNDHVGIDELYQLYAPNVKRMILANQGNTDDAADIFQEALVAIYKLSADRAFVLTCPFEAFLITVCKRIWLNQLKKKGRSPVTKSMDDGFTIEKSDEMEANILAEQIEREHALLEVLESMGEKCRSIIKACMGKEHQEKVAESLGLTYAYLRKKKSECMAQLGKLVKEHPFFK